MCILSYGLVYVKKYNCKNVTYNLTGKCSLTNVADLLKSCVIIGLTIWGLGTAWFDKDAKMAEIQDILDGSHEWRYRMGRDRSGGSRYGICRASELSRSSIEYVWT